MGDIGIQGVRRQCHVRTTRRTEGAPRAPDLVDRDFTAIAPDRLWVTDLVRHEAPLNLAVMKGHRHMLVAAGVLKLRAA